MTGARDQRDEARLVAALKAVEIQDLGPSRLELERRRLMARLAFQPSPALRGSRFALAAGFAGAALAAAAVLTLVLIPALDGAEDSAVVLSGTWRLEPGDAISRGLPVRVDEGGRARLELPDGTGVEAAAGTRLALRDGDASAVHIEEGHAVIAVAPRTPPGMFRAFTPDAEIQVHGTVFSLTVDPRAGTTVRLHEGEVRLISGDRAIAMRPGHRVVASVSGLVSLGTFDDGERVLDASLAPGDVPPGGDPGPILARLRKPAAGEPAPGGPAETEADTAPEVEAVAPEPAPEPPAPVRFFSVRHSPAPSLGERVSEAQRLGDHAAVVELTDDTFRRFVQEDEELLFRRGRSLGRLGRWSEAAEVYRRVAAAGTGRGAEALYLTADALRRAGDLEQSAAYADRAIDAGGPNADHAWSIKLGALTGLRRYQAAAEAAEAYLVSNPAGAHVGEAHFVRGTGLRLERRWAEAAEAYGRFLERGEGSAAIVEDGEFYRGYCLLMAGSREPGSAALEGYLERHPYGRHAAKARTAIGR